MWHLVGFRMLRGAAMAQLKTVLGTEKEPTDWDAFWSFIVKSFPHGLSMYTVADRFETFAFRQGERVRDAFERFKVIQNDATQINYPYEERTIFMSILPTRLKEHVQAEFVRKALAGQPMTFSQVVLCAMTEEALNPANTNPTIQPSRPKRKNKRKSPPDSHDTSDIVCYNCQKKGHIFGGLENPTCPEKPTRRTKNYFKRMKIKGGTNALGSGSGKGKRCTT
ncbi:uncharacterized protein MELLADRAFT_72348 [Melampsora larici-populina 98AG31]|uniref:CCHC-type domain-containing protein n=1 Tax=Melampsora larici-populina (strain 98AG31 / pathotype 3-4-7) TaxID=747676 RepID=F4RSS9_MELLP|nr:uncharacterized protein MELLADRAFT_72348 [Melampsora larici-populina 98AG31]EGG04386.1 hypothetical protein MELLADRAFT_72348 [Melampsora larici-populina 98AG31]